MKGISIPPPAPRDVPRNYNWRILLTDGWAIVGGVFSLIGFIFGLVGLPFAALGLLFLTGGMAALVRRYGLAQKTVEVLREGEPALGEILEVYQNFYVQVNGRHPWTIIYHFEVSGQEYEGKVTTLSRPDLRQQPGTQAYVLYAPADPTQNTIYPHPYGYHRV